MINDKKNEYWVSIERSQDKTGVLYYSNDNKEYLEHFGKWLIFGNPKYIKDLAIKLDCYIDKGEIDSAKYNRKPSPVGRGECVMCVYCDDRDKDRVWNILSLLEVKKKIWKYDQQTYKDWEVNGRLHKQWENGSKL
jgi:hypothetical protein